jgi:hypothetical protein
MKAEAHTRNNYEGWSDPANQVATSTNLHHRRLDAPQAGESVIVKASDNDASAPVHHRPPA